VVEITVWGIPLAIILFLGVVSWRSTHLLDPYRPLAGTGDTLNVQVVALDWKWLFIYPDQHIATVNELEIPTGRQVNFLITSDSVMNVFFIPQLGTQIYAMEGMQTQLHLLAKNPGIYRGISANFSGDGFADMRFSTIAVDPARFSAWVTQVQGAPGALNATSYAALARPSSANPVAQYGKVEPNLFGQIVMAHAGTTRMAGKMQ
jgi:cytochrome o ubiquinol oxidase subunit 2